MKTFLFVCTGNVCRSPMAEALFRHKVGARRDVKVISAGVDTVNGQKPTPLAGRAMSELGMDTSALRSSVLTVDQIDEADYVFAMTQSHLEAIKARYPGAIEKTFLLREFDDSLEPFEKEIPDPIGGSYDVYLHCRDQIEQGINFLVDYLSKWEVITPEDEDSHKISTFAIASDHGGFDLKEAVKEHLSSGGLKIKDFGTDSKESTDYPDYAQKVAQSIVQGQTDAGLLICTSGVGMSIAANKVPGVRAALVFTDEMASLARRHNNANVICLGSNQTTPKQAATILDAFLKAHFEGGRHERRVNKLENGSKDN